MKDDNLNNTIIILSDEPEIITSRSGGPGGQHVNKANTRVTIRWNVKNSKSLTAEQKERVLEKLHTQLTNEGDLIIHASSSRSQLANKKQALLKLNEIIQKALQIPKKRLSSKTPKAVKEARLQTKKRHSFIKKLRSKHFQE